MERSGRKTLADGGDGAVGGILDSSAMVHGLIGRRPRYGLARKLDRTRLAEPEMGGLQRKPQVRVHGINEKTRRMTVSDIHSEDSYWDESTEDPGRGERCGIQCVVVEPLYLSRVNAQQK